MRVRFWGTRGSIAKAGPSTVRYGGNTSCVEVRSRGGTLIVLDCGTGAHGLGHALMAERSRPHRGHILITHTHWDHIQGFPFFAPLFQPGDEWDVYAPRGLRESLRETLAGQMQYTYFPVGLENFEAAVRYHDLVEGAFTIGDVHVTTRYMNHTALTFGYRLEADGAALVYATDHEPHSRALAEGSADDIHGEDRRHADFIAGADLLIHDAQYTAAEYPAKMGWGHSTAEAVVALARSAGVRRLALFHHDPLRDDAGLDRVIAAARLRAGRALAVVAAAEGGVFEMASSGTPDGARRAEGHPHAVAHHAAPPATAETHVPGDLLSQTVLIAVDDAKVRAALVEAARDDQLSPVVATDPDEVLSIVGETPPSLVLLGRHLGGADGLALCRALRKHASAHAAALPIVMVAATSAEADRPAGADAGVTDWLVPPFSTLYARTRIRAWALRLACRWMAAQLPDDEAARLRALHDIGILDTPADERFDRITRLARRLFDVPVALVTLVDADRQWFKSRQGLDDVETHRDLSFCAHAIHEEGPFVVQDTLLDARFADNPAVTGTMRVRFYAGRSVHVDGQRVGTLCVADRRPRELRNDELGPLEDLAALVEQELAKGR